MRKLTAISDRLLSLVAPKATAAACPVSYTGCWQNNSPSWPATCCTNDGCAHITCYHN